MTICDERKGEYKWVRSPYGVLIPYHHMLPPTKGSKRKRRETIFDGKNEKEKDMKNKAVLVTTEFRGVFFGYVKNDSKLPDEITLTKVQNCIYWSSDCNGFLGLAVNGPTPSCKIGVEVPELRLFKVTSVSPVSDEAAAKWNA